MLLKVKHEELENVTGVMVKDGDAYDIEIDKMLEQIEKLRTIWQGKDAEIFCDNVTNYITKMKNIPKCLRNMSKFVNNVNNGYTEQDESFSKELETEANNYDEGPSSDNEFSTIPGSY
jgi:uncharacterized protein YukE